MFDGVTIGDPVFHHSPSLPALHLSQPSPGSTSSLNGDRHLEPPQTYENLLAMNTSFKTRINELEVINNLFRDRVAELEQTEANARRSEMLMRESDASLRQSLDEVRRNEHALQMRVSDLRWKLDERNGEKDSEPPAKRLRLSDVVAEEET